MRRNYASPCQGPQKSPSCLEMHRAGACGPCPRPVSVQFGDLLVSGLQARGLASLQGLHLVSFSFSFLSFFQLSTSRVSHLSTLCSLECPVYNVHTLKGVFVLKRIANSPPGSSYRDNGSEVRRGESMHTSPPELKVWVSLVGSLAQAEEALRKEMGRCRPGLCQPQH